MLLKLFSGTAGVPPANAPQARSPSEAATNSFSRFALTCGRGARVLTEELELFSRAPMPGSEYFRLALSGDSCFQIRLPLRQLLSHPFQRCLCGIGE